MIETFLVLALIVACVAVGIAVVLFGRVAAAEASLRAEREKNQWTEDAKEQFKNTFKVSPPTSSSRGQIS